VTLPPKIKYMIDLTTAVAAVPAAGSATRSITAADQDDLARLMLDAYIGTIDYEGETLDDATGEVGSFYADSPLLDCSFIATADGSTASAVLVSGSEEGPMVGYVMTAAAHKRRGLAHLVVSRALRELHNSGYTRVTLFITEGNTASEALFSGLGAVRL
jgi:RimJ/RimL family protein N-acetyltransferase